MSVTAFATTVGHNPVAGEIVNEDGSVNVGIQPTLRLGLAFVKDKYRKQSSENTALANLSQALYAYSACAKAYNA